MDTSVHRILSSLGQDFFVPLWLLLGYGVSSSSSQHPGASTHLWVFPVFSVTLVKPTLLWFFGKDHSKARNGTHVEEKIQIFPILLTLVPFPLPQSPAMTGFFFLNLHIEISASLNWHLSFIFIFFKVSSPICCAEMLFHLDLCSEMV